MNGINKVILVGTLGKDPEVRYSSNGNAIANFSVATNESWKDKNTGQKVDKTEWHNIVMFGKVAEIAGEYLRKGSQVYLEGKIKTEKYQDRTTGEDRYSTKIECRDMQMLGGKTDNQQSQQGYQTQQQGGFQQQAPQQPQQGGFQQSPPAVQQMAQQKAMQSGGAPQAMAQQEPSMDFDDSIPFAPIGLQHKALLSCM